MDNTQEGGEPAARPPSLAEKSLAGLMTTLGAAAVVIGLSIFLGGAAMTAHVAELVSAPITGAAPTAASAFSPTAENELGFYSALWIAYGAVLIATARDLRRRLGRVPILAAIFFAGGLGRTLAWLRAGPPHPAFIGLMAIELALPVVFIGLWAVARRGV